VRHLESREAREVQLARIAGAWREQAPYRRRLKSRAQLLQDRFQAEGSEDHG
jgi:hypothetical protein